MRLKPNITFYRRLSLITLASVYFLIFVGGVVRSTGSGMGCPDWPKCFGQWVPPTTIDDLPENYKEIYAEQRAVKNTRFTTYLDALGFSNLADEIRNDDSILVEANFNVTKTWTEYLNRLVGVIVGFLILATFVISISFIGTNPKIFIVSLLSLVAVGFQGWIGSIVVSTNLLQWMITVHMLLALIILALLTYQYVLARTDKQVSRTFAPSKLINLILLVLITLTVVQVVMGTQVREEVDLVAEKMNFTSREAWIDQLGSTFYFHRSFSLLIVLAHIYLLFRVVKYYGNQGNLMNNTLVLLIVILAEVFTGVIMAYFAIPRLAQPLHLLFASLVFGIQLYIWMKIQVGGANVNVRFSHNKDEVINNDSHQVYS
ncbi:cytochrome c oxidase assembly protein subunit 15 [Catalinimonas alkaloidigena]|uniref:COX15/CtaA family protein n=1 Tax=Catalinimonas alkaloidigena TaxID=1075417 RepID=UPI00240663E5|nr:COX15/CtaA family protein [Catalinimonas alkaloidigena]MDF9796917.1 cytochrome c oxidase assembly protein subunit 15 [Catalinimonas alkaloidigena]